MSEETIDDIIEGFELKLNEMYSKKDSKEVNTGEKDTSKPVFELPPETTKAPETTASQSTEKTGENSISTALTTNNLIYSLYLVIPAGLSAILYYMRPKWVRKGSKIDRFKFARYAFIITVLVWAGITFYLSQRVN